MANPMPPRRRRDEVARCLMALIGLVVAGAAHSDVITINPDGTADYTSIQAGIEAASDGDEVVIMPGRYTGSGVLLDPLGKTIHIRGLKGPAATIIDGEGRHEFVWIRNGEGRGTVIEGLTFRGGRYSGSGSSTAGGCMRLAGTSPTVRDCIFEDNIVTGTTWWTGAAVYARGGSPLFESCLFRENFDESNEIAYFEDGCEPYLTGCVFVRNAGVQVEVQDGSRITASACAFVANTDSPLRPTTQITLWNSPATSEMTACYFLGNRQGGEPWTVGGSAINMPNAFAGSDLVLSDTTIHDCGEGEPPIGELPWQDGGGNWIGAPCIETDCDDDGIVDAEAIWLGVVDDCDQDWMPDACEPDADADGVPDECDGCPTDPHKTDPGICGCGLDDVDTDGDGIEDCLDSCPTWPYDCSEDGTTIVVSPGQPISLAISKVPDGGLLKLMPGIFNQAIDFAGRAITIEGDVADPTAVILDGTLLVDSSVVTMITGEGSDSVLRGVTIRNGTSGTVFDDAMVGGAIHTRESSPTIEDCIFEQNTAEYGGAVYARMGAPAFRRCTFRENSADHDGGGLQFSLTEGGTLENCVFEGNLANRNGGAVHLFGGTPALVACAMAGNIANGAGGGVTWSSTGEPASITDSTIVNNIATVGGGVRIAGKGADLTITGTTVCDNSPDEIAGPYVDGGGNDICTCPADYDGDGDVDAADLGLWLTYAGTECEPGGPCPGDLDGDGEIRGSDLGLILLQWGLCD